MNFKIPTRPNVLKKYDNKLHIEIVKVNNGADTYCMKEDTRLEGPFEFGIRPVKRSSKTDWALVLEQAKKGDFSKIPDDIVVKHYNNLKHIAKDHQVTVNRTYPREVLWWYGESGAGKSRRTQVEYPDAYMKHSNKWWDGYQN